MRKIKNLEGENPEITKDELRKAIKETTNKKSTGYRHCTSNAWEQKP